MQASWRVWVAVSTSLGGSRVQARASRRHRRQNATSDTACGNGTLCVCVRPLVGGPECARGAPSRASTPLTAHCAPPVPRASHLHHGAWLQRPGPSIHGHKTSFPASHQTVPWPLPTPTPTPRMRPCPPTSTSAPAQGRPQHPRRSPQPVQRASAACQYSMRPSQHPRTCPRQTPGAPCARRTPLQPGRGARVNAEIAAF